MASIYIFFRWRIGLDDIFFSLTSSAEGAIIGSGAAVAQVPVVLLHTLSPVAAIHAVAGTMASATGLDPGRHLGPLIQVKGDAVHP